MITGPHDNGRRYPEPGLPMTHKSLEDAQFAAIAMAISGDAGGLYRIVGSLLDEGFDFETVLFEVLMPSESQVGQRWQQGDYLIAEEHAATATVETVVSMMIGSLEQPESGMHVVIATAEGDQHSLPARAVAAHLLFLGYRTSFLGANLPARDLREYLESEDADAMVLSCAMTNHLLGARAVIRESHICGVPVLAGGRGYGTEGQWARIVGADGWVAAPREVGAKLDSWRPDMVAAEASAANPTPELLRLIDRQPAIVGAARSRLWKTIDADPDPRLSEEIELLVRSVLVSEFVDSVSPIHETLQWQAQTLEYHGYETAPHLVAAAASALGEVDATLADRLIEAVEAD